MTGTLKQYAIDRVLTSADSQLYRYVAAGDAVPIAVLETEMKPLLASFDATKAEAFEADYHSFLTEDAKQEPVVLVPMGDPSERRFKAGGSIDKGLAQAIEQVHGVAPETLVSQLVERTMRTINPDHPVRIENISMEEQLDDIIAKLEGDKPAEGAYYDTTQPLEPMTPEEVFDGVYDGLPENPFDDYVAGQDTPGITELPDDEVYAPQAPVAPDFQPVAFIEPDGSLYEFKGEESDYIPRHTTAEPVVVEVEQASAVLQDMKRIYKEFIEALKQKGLDKRLELQLA